MNNLNHANLYSHVTIQSIPKTQVQVLMEIHVFHLGKLLPVGERPWNWPQRSSNLGLHCEIFISPEEVWSLKSGVFTYAVKLV